MLAKQIWKGLFLTALVADIIVLTLGFESVHFFLKPLLMPLLIIGLLVQKRNSNERNWQIILGGLLMAWMGDIFLLFPTTTNWSFIAGLICFLLTHAAFIYYFSRYNKGIFRWMYQHPMETFLILLYAIFIYGLLLPSLNVLTYPVAIYTLAITLMLLQAFSTQDHTAPASNRQFVPGAICFVISDSILALDKFAHTIPLAGSLIMFFYGIGQLLIVNGTIGNSDEMVEELV